MTEPIRIVNLSVYHQTKRGPLKAVQEVSLNIATGETLGLVGESGCGKSTLARSVVGLNLPTMGEVLIGDEPIGRGMAARRRAAKLVQMVFQDPMSSLNPRLTVRNIIEQPLRVHGIGSRAERSARVKELMDQVGIGLHHADKFPHELSGGQRQRVSIARALALQPKALVCDEAVSALDVSVQAQVLNLLVKLQQDTDVAILFISHDLSVVRFVSDRIAVMYLGRVVEIGPAESVWNDALHPYTRALLAANLDRQDGASLAMETLDGEPPSPMNPPKGCAFVSRCAHAQEICASSIPKLTDDGLPHSVACHRAAEFVRPTPATSTLEKI